MTVFIGGFVLLDFLTSTIQINTIAILCAIGSVHDQRRLLVGCEQEVNLGLEYLDVHIHSSGAFLYLFVEAGGGGVKKRETKYQLTDFLNH